jgi:hypothetical protein
VDDRSLKDGATWDDAVWRRREYSIRFLKGIGGPIVLGDQMDEFAVELEKAAEAAIA